jgi:CBS domain-containing protein
MADKPSPPPGEVKVPSIAADLMDPNPPSVRPETRVGDVARLLLERHLSGVPVVSETGEVLGVVTQADLVSRHAYVHFPFYLNILGGVIPLTSTRHFREEMRRVIGRTAADVMTTDPCVVAEDTDLREVATRMAEDGADPVVVVRDGRLAGLLTRADLVRLIVVEEDTRA